MKKNSISLLIISIVGFGLFAGLSVRAAGCELASPIVITDKASGQVLSAPYTIQTLKTYDLKAGYKNCEKQAAFFVVIGPDGGENQIGPITPPLLSGAGVVSGQITPSGEFPIGQYKIEFRTVVSGAFKTLSTVNFTLKIQATGSPGATGGNTGNAGTTPGKGVGDKTGDGTGKGDGSGAGDSTKTPGSSGGLVPCGNGPNDYCTLCDFLKLIDNIKNFVMFKLLPPLAVLFVVIAGFFILTAGASPGNYKKGTKMLSDLALGLLIIFGAYMITNTILKVLAGGSDISDRWYRIECSVEGGFSIGTGIGAGSSGVKGNSQQLAQQILDSGKIKLATSHPNSPDKGDTAAQNIRDAAAGKPAKLQSGATVALDPRMLAGLIEVSKKFNSINVSEITGATHSGNSQHYKGTAFDINYADGVHLTCNASKVAAVISACKAVGATFTLDESCSANHVHCDWR